MRALEVDVVEQGWAISPLLSTVIGAAAAGLFTLLGGIVLFRLKGSSEHSTWLRDQRVGAYVRFIRLSDQLRSVRQDLESLMQRQAQEEMDAQVAVEALHVLGSLEKRLEDLKDEAGQNMAEASVLFPEAVHEKIVEFQEALAKPEMVDLGGLVNEVLELMRRSLRVK